MCWSSVEHVIVAVHDTLPPTDAEWKGYVAHYQAHASTAHAVLVYSQGGGPSGLQRAALLEVIDRLEKIPPAHMLTASSMVRGIVTAFSWFLPPERRMKTYGIDDIERVFDAMALSTDAQSRTRIREAIIAHLSTLKNTSVARAG